LISFVEDTCENNSQKYQHNNNEYNTYNTLGSGVTMWLNVNQFVKILTAVVGVPE
jgi:flagellar biosynthesis chaperone FliJ